MSRFGRTILIRPEVNFSVAVGYADTFKVEFLLAGKGPKISHAPQTRKRYIACPRGQSTTAALCTPMLFTLIPCN
jgi:hypothetical protein